MYKRSARKPYTNENVVVPSLPWWHLVFPVSTRGKSNAAR